MSLPPLSIMPAGPSSSKKPQKKVRDLERDSEERKGLLAVNNDDPDETDIVDENYSSKRRKKVLIVACSLIALLLTGTFARSALWARPDRQHQVTAGNMPFHNGTHPFQRTVILVSIDGLRADYLDRGLTPHLLDLSRKGIRAKSMKPIFPTLTFPNHWALMTGLHAESHGIVANTFWDPRTQKTFYYNRVSSAWSPEWWLGEPMWETAEKANIITANLMWPGPPKTMAGTSSTYFVPWKDHVPLDSKLEQILNWVDLPFEKRPQLILAYEPSLDQAGHATGPNSSRVNKTLSDVDRFARNLHDLLDARNLTDIIDVIFVSDHGMTDTSHPERIYMDDFLGQDGLDAIAHSDGWPSMGIRFREGVNTSHYLQQLLKGSDENPEKFDVFTHDTMPERYHFANHERIAPIHVIPKMGYILTTKAEGDAGIMSKGNHGYDNDEVSMQAMFVAHGPFSIDAKAQHQASAQLTKAPKASKGWYSTTHNTYVMEPFRNVEIYNLIMKLLDITPFASPNNGTTGFWDQYL